MDDDDLKPCLASQVVARLQEMIAQHGDKPIYVYDLEMQWPYPLGLVHRPEDEDHAERFEITSGWGDRPEGYIGLLSP